MEKGTLKKRSRNAYSRESVQEMIQYWSERKMIKEEACTSSMDGSLRDVLKNELTCHVCTSYMASPIFQCKNGHTLCTQCSSKVYKKCPTCRKLLKGSRNRALENIAAVLNIPCKYAHQGCSEKIPHFFNISEHESRCKFRPSNCIHAKSGCKFVENANLMDVQELIRFWRKRKTIKEEACMSSMDDSLRDALKNELTCHVCASYMASFIFQCKNGHTLCTHCNSKVNNKCPTCRELLEDSRNQALENIAAVVSLSCKYTHQGCSEKIPHFFNISEHESRCRFRPYNCIHAESGCKFVGNVNSLLKHMEEHNGNDGGLILSDRNEFVIECDLEELKENDNYAPVVKAYDSYFFFHLEKYYVGISAHARAYMEYLGDQDEANKFLCEIKIGEQSNGPVFKGIPQSISKTRNIKEENPDIFKIMFTQAQSYSSHNETDGSVLSMHCKILMKSA